MRTYGKFLFLFALKSLLLRALNHLTYLFRFTIFSRETFTTGFSLLLRLFWHVYIIVCFEIAVFDMVYVRLCVAVKYWLCTKLILMR